jgi:hypothetical protein
MKCRRNLDIRVSVHRDTIYENDQQDATVWDNLLFLDCSTCFEPYFRSSSGASKLYYSFCYYTRMSMPAGRPRVKHFSSITAPNKLQLGIVYRTNCRKTSNPHLSHCSPLFLPKQENLVSYLL